jgi:hypothetical protein
LEYANCATIVPTFFSCENQGKEKKMPNPKTSRTKEKHYNYLPATLRETKKSGRLIEYYVENPNTGQLERMRIRVNSIYKRFLYKKDAKLHIYSIVSSINMKLSNGWNPFYEHRENSRLYSNVDTICALNIEEKEKELRPETLRSYRNFCSVFLKWFNANFKQMVFIPKNGLSYNVY